jgi:hypothetical protein
MKSKKGFIILISVVAVIIAGALLSRFVNWPVDTSETSGDIAKASRFSRQTAAESLSLMEELIRSDEDYKNAVVVSYVVMQMRAEQFGTLVDMSNEVAGEIPAFAGVLGKMNEVREMADNACATLAEAGESLEAILGGESRPEVGQQTNNAALAYLALQKQNKLATQFIDTADNYLAANEGSDELKFARDQWLEYQQATASLEGDSKLEKKLAGKEALLPPGQSDAVLGVLYNVPTLDFHYYTDHTQHLCDMPLVIENFNFAFQALAPQTELGYIRELEDNVLGKAGQIIEEIASGNVESLEAYLL